MLTSSIIADLRPVEECGDPDHPALRVRRTNAARVFFHRHDADARVWWLQKWADYLDALTVSNVVLLRAA